MTVVWLAAAEAAAADLPAGRAWPAGDASRIARVYPGRVRSHAFSPNFKDGIAGRQPPLPYRRDGERDVWVEEREAMLYRGAPPSLVGVGHERTEYVCCDGERLTIDKYVQVVEFRNVWPGEGETSTVCSTPEGRWGSCSNVEPVGDLPPMAPVPTPEPPPRALRCGGDNAPEPIGPGGIDGVTADDLASAVAAADAIATRPAAQPATAAPLAFLLEQRLVNVANHPDMVTITCAPVADRELVPMRGTLRVGLCDRETQLTDAQICAAREAPWKLWLRVREGPARQLGKMALPVAWTPSRTRQGETVVDEIPVSVIGHGIITFYTTVTTTASSRYALVIQVQSEDACRSEEACRQLRADLVALSGALGDQLLRR